MRALEHCAGVGVVAIAGKIVPDEYLLDGDG
jgi:hypothetical protein